MEENRILFALLHSAICGKKLKENEKSLLSEKLVQELFLISDKHDIAHLLAVGLENNSFVTENHQKIQEKKFKAIYRYTQLNQDYQKMCEALEAANISFIPLKGSVLRKCYREEWMRTSCDIDVLVHEADIEKAALILMKNCGYIKDRKSSHDISLYTPTKQHVELHYTLIEEGRVNASSQILSKVWEFASIRKGYQYWYEMADVMFYFYHIAHMAKHFEIGGCGIRPFIDLWILDNLEGVDVRKRDDMLHKGELFRFAEAVRKLSRIWFNEEKMDETSQKLENFILHGGVYGSNDNRIILQQQKRGGRINYVLSRIFLPYHVIKFEYPILQRYRWLTPVMEICRWFRFFSGGRAKRSLQELKYNNSILDSEAAEMRDFLKKIGL